MSHTTPEGWILILGFVALVALIARPMGAWHFAIYEGRLTFASYALGPVERLLYYAYPGSSGGDFEFFEPYANVSITRGPVTAKVGGAFAPSQDGIGDNSNVYLFGDLSVAIPNTPVSLTGHLGNSHGDTTLTPSGDYVDWSLGATVAWHNLAFGVSYVDTNLSGAEAASGGATRDIVDGAVVATVAANF